MARALCPPIHLFHLAEYFPLQPFQQEVVKDRAYAPDWGGDERLQASVDAIDIAEALCDPRLSACSLSTIPGSFLPWGQGPH